MEHSPYWVCVWFRIFIISWKSGFSKTRIHLHHSELFLSILKITY